MQGSSYSSSSYSGEMINVWYTQQNLIMTLQMPSGTGTSSSYGTGTSAGTGSGPGFWSGTIKRISVSHVYVV